MFSRDDLQRQTGMDREQCCAIHRTDLVCAPDSGPELVATLRKETIAAGDNDGQVDFPGTGKRYSRKKLAIKALAHVIRLLIKNGHVSETGAWAAHTAASIRTPWG